jgi:hypothetical protein
VRSSTATNPLVRCARTSVGHHIQFARVVTYHAAVFADASRRARNADSASGRICAGRKGRRLFDDGDAPYHLKMTATEGFPTGVIRVIYSPTEEPAKVGDAEVKDQVPGGE